ncbi:DUF3397 family protein [Kurthia sibirica]|uniref:DUF3397 domain-containing protein n=1 Tax=Kurthia sibirica TaxID=202750 RepID=A0A2U3AQH5_9BACL|nr:DUF3397 family protein [Kurthia sibirica]PWI26810.1 hypothetical protein DEX24_00495 [Kurthia sibirica]GEK32653.1 hypothetical protein KSI01_01860 [Kurthia sibirica]
MAVISWIVQAILICPWIVWGLLFIGLKKSKRGQQNAFQFASDVTTFILLWSITVIIELFFNINIMMLPIIVAIILAIILLLIEWRTHTELDVIKFIKKIWRIFFIVLTISYIVIVLSYGVVKIIHLFQ